MSHARRIYRATPTAVGRGAIGIIRRDGRYLMIKRAAIVARGGCWCFPGGHVEHGESSGAAVIRELHEELGLHVRPERKLGYVRVPESRYVLAAWLVQLVGGTLRPDPQEVAQAAWCEARRVRDMTPSLPSNNVVFNMLGI